MDMLTCRRCGGLTPPESSSTCLHCDATLPRPPRWARRLSALLGPAGAILLAACYGGPGRYRVSEPMPHGLTRADRDHDGALGAYECRNPAGGDCAALIARTPAPDEVDCDDANPAVFPGAADLDGDGADSNCDGVDGWTDTPAVRAVDPAYAEPPPAAPAVQAVEPAHAVPAPAGAAPAPAPASSPPATIARPPASP